MVLSRRMIRVELSRRGKGTWRPSGSKTSSEGVKISLSRVPSSRNAVLTRQSNDDESHTVHASLRKSVQQRSNQWKRNDPRDPMHRILCRCTSPLMMRKKILW